MNRSSSALRTRSMSKAAEGGVKITPNQDTDELPAQRKRREANPPPSAHEPLQPIDREWANPYGGGGSVSQQQPEAADGNNNDINMAFYSEMDQWVRGEDSNSVPIPLPAKQKGAASPKGKRDSTSQSVQRISMGNAQFKTPGSLRRQRKGEAAGSPLSDLSDGEVLLGNNVLQLYGLEVYAVCYTVVHGVFTGVLSLRTAEEKANFLLEPDQDKSSSDEDGDKKKLFTVWKRFMNRIGKLADKIGSARSALLGTTEEDLLGDRLDALYEAVDEAMAVADKAGFGEEISKEHKNFLKAVEKHQRSTLGYSYRYRDQPAAAASEARENSTGEADIDEKMGRIVAVPVPHHAHPDLFNTKYQCIEPRQRKRCLDDHTMLPHPRKGTQSGIEDFLVHDQVTNDVLATILNHVQLNRSLMGLPNTVSGVMYSLVYNGDAESYANRLTRVDGVNQILRAVPRLLAKRGATMEPMLQSCLELSTMCHVAQWQEETNKAVSNAALLLKRAEGPLSAANGLREIGSVPLVRLPNFIGDKNCRQPVMDTLRLLADPACMAVLESTVLPLLHITTETQKEGSMFAGSQLSLRCDPQRRAELMRLTAGFEIPHLPAVATFQQTASSSSVSLKRKEASFPITQPILLVIEAITALAEQVSELCILTPPEASSSDQTPPCVKAMYKALAKQGMDAESVAEWALSDPTCGGDLAGARIPAVAILVDAIAVRLAAMLRDSGSRRALSLIMRFEEFMDDDTRSAGSLFHRVEDPAVRNGYRIQWLHEAIRQKLIAVHSAKEVSSGKVAIPDVFLLTVPVGDAAQDPWDAAGSFLCSTDLCVAVAPRRADALSCPLLQM